MELSSAHSLIHFLFLITLHYMLDIYTLGDEILSEKAVRVKEFDSALAILIDAMFETMDEADGVGLAGPQVGASSRLFVVDTRHPGERMAFINPEIVETSVEMVPYEEGCLSIPGVYHDVMRPASVTVQAQDVKGRPFTLKAEGLLARVIQHENDHLDGHLFIDRLGEEERRKVVKQYERKHKEKRKKGK